MPLAKLHCFNSGSDMEIDDEELFSCYAVGSYGPYPITFYRRHGKYFYQWPEDCEPEHGPYDSVEVALKAAEGSFYGDVGGFWKTLEEAEKQADWMREQGYGVDG
jgi:hypothetical protein